MRIYAVADIHGKTEKIEKIKEVLLRNTPDILVIAGDMTNYFSPLKTFDQLKSIPIPILGIRGNSDLKPVERLLQNQKNTTLLGSAPVTYQGVPFLGLNGTIPLPFVSKICFKESCRLDGLKYKITPQTILVVHLPPRGVCDKVGNRFCAGSFHLKTFIEKHPPLMVLCGHIHEQAGYQFFKNILVVNCAMNKNFSGAIIDSCKNTTLKVKMIINDR
ncbi:MAG: metallophosphoesterase [Deltaproteobacteria bacterium]|uniref:metallophosphoesterase family protein n=1 Tax=Desulfobacula sp. TaxID=2593537 RepID=UPI0019B05E16|nr:metallophosphoesterase [Candidatus Desulfobacula maris]MBL6993513.1 metallophosphoesterase [Desulfobacula sp.]